MTTIEGLRAWFADEIDVKLAPGSTGTAIDDGTTISTSETWPATPTTRAGAAARTRWGVRALLLGCCGLRTLVSA